VSPGRPSVYDWGAYAAELLDLLVTSPIGLDRYEIEERLDLAHPYHVGVVIQHLRRMLAKDDTVNVVVARDGFRSVYYLSGSVSESMPWTQTRFRDQLTRLETTAAIWRSVASGLDARSAEGRIARNILKWNERLLEDVRDELASGLIA
jgi:hypothetical protein